MAKNRTSLRALYLNGCDNVTDQGVIALAKACSNLHTLYLNGCFKITDEAIMALAECQNLHTLHLSGCKNITYESVIALVKKCTSLHTLDLTRCAITLDKNRLLNLFNLNQNLQIIISPLGVEIFRPTPILAPRALTASSPTPSRTVPTSPIPSAASQNSSIKNCFHIFSTVVLGAILSNIIGWKTAAAVSVVYLTHKFTRFFEFRGLR